MLKSKVSFLGAAITAVLIGMVANNAASQQPTIENKLSDFEARFQAAQDANWHLYAPKAYGEAQEKLEEAKARFQKGGKIENIENSLAEAQRKLTEAGQFVDIGQVVLPGAITARSDALAAGAPDHAPQEWERAKQTMYDAGRSVEKGDNNDAQRKSKEAETQFREAELMAIRVDLLGGAGAARDAALKVDADEKAPRTFNAGIADLNAAEKTLQGDRYQRGQAKDQAKAATLAFRHAAYIAGEIERVQSKRASEFESRQLEHEAILAGIAQDLAIPVDFSAGIPTAGATVANGVASLKADRDNLRDELTRRVEELKLATARADSLDQTLAKLEKREQSTVATMQRERKRQEDIRALGNLFSTDQATVVQQGDELICRVYGLSFASGSSVIQPQNFSLLTKIQSALRMFPEAAVIVEGHTDSAGDADLNQRLSLQRAEAVRAYIVANMPADAGRISVTGYGESVPLASNETPAGRAKNRRIDIRLAHVFGQN